MPEKIQVPADLEEICDAFEDYSVNHRYYLDFKTGEIIFITKGKEESEEQIDEWFAECCIAIPKISSSDGCENMEHFIESVEDEALQKKLCIAIDGKGAFRRFKNVLLRHPEEREKWFKFQNARVKERVREWLEDECIELVRAKPIEIMEISPRELSYSKEIEASWKGFGPRACLKCGNEEVFEEKHFILSRCPNSREEEEWLDATMKKQYGVEHYDIAAGVFGDDRGLIEFAVCKKCRSQDVFFDF